MHELEFLSGSLSQKGFKGKLNLDTLEGHIIESLIDKPDTEWEATIINKRGQKSKDERYGDPFDNIDEETAKNKGADYYRLWKQNWDNLIEQGNLNKAIDYAINPQQVGMKKTFIVFNGEGAEDSIQKKDNIENFESIENKSGELRITRYITNPTREQRIYNDLYEIISLFSRNEHFSFYQLTETIKQKKYKYNFEEVKGFVYLMIDKNYIEQEYFDSKYNERFNKIPKKGDPRWEDSLDTQMLNNSKDGIYFKLKNKNQ